MSSRYSHAASIARIGRMLSDFVLPPLCLGCRKPTAEHHGLCGQCWLQLPFIDRPYCQRLGLPFGYDIGPDALSAEAIADPPPFERARAAVRYDEIARHLVLSLKFRDRQEMARLLSQLMTQAGKELLADADLIVPVPLHSWRLLTRRFNQAALLAQGLSKISGVPIYSDGLMRVRRTEQQVGLPKNQRINNVRGAFRLNPSAGSSIAHRKILLIDDVYTTGATVKACTRVLLRANAKAVDVLTFARVVGEEFDIV